MENPTARREAECFIKTNHKFMERTVRVTEKHPSPRGGFEVPGPPRPHGGHRAGVLPRGRVLFGLGCQIQQTLTSLPLSRVSEQRITCSFFSGEPKVSL